MHENTLKGGYLEDLDKMVREDLDKMVRKDEIILSNVCEMKWDHINPSCPVRAGSVFQFLIICT